MITSKHARAVVSDLERSHVSFHEQAERQVVGSPMHVSMLAAGWVANVIRNAVLTLAEELEKDGR